MFEDNAQPMQPAQSGQAPDAKPATPQAVEDIFADTDSTPTPPQSPPQAGGESMIQPGPPTALTSGKLKPLPTAEGNSVPSNQVSGAKEESSFPFKKLFIILGITSGIITIAVIAFFVFKSTLPKQAEQNQDVGAPENNIQTPIAPAENQEQIDNSQEDNQDSASLLDNFKQTQQDKALNPIAQDMSSKDTDQDGLTDAKEFDIGTNYRLVDSDNDGLSDWEEVSIFGTDPLDKDSDNDSYLDGEEVQNGYNPLGDGKLLDFEKAQ
ncbi:MAG: hypothetical protein AUJ34_02865 [Parcubacteria group bacterium CG1_02_41_12]|nr:MAG: hypothetical protein AUJ34_02865 [Parcubacteria group bacterium CG1_02_41_12]PIP67189.1 MAG: hypothetical protein COW93_01485 [Parcubacteria group bacterium CG22_combo_CG10-13_8_21_14_all_41_9]PIR57454.1 MAG: hypothetical protein COU72_00895 [Parcubacteria group bacterium CG10_big_fil_rev_8_21_14_0_10_41_35]PIZ81262.1 MAG: hypothetical protein COY02_02985 [Parcubacteria group bacterium CG_4_10_14_0_2_um_filter_41_6]